MPSAAHILVVDTEPASHAPLQGALQQAGYVVQFAHTGQAALDLHRARPSQLVLVEALLPDLDGFAVCVELRLRSRVPIVMLTALRGIAAILQGFSVGVDDYITKPYHVAVVVVRLRAVLRRSAWPPPRADGPLLGTPELLLNETYHEVWVRGVVVAVTPGEYQLLRHLMRHPNCPFSAGALAQTVWGAQALTDTNFVAVMIRRLRAKIEEDPAHPHFLRTVPGVGYLLALPPPPAAVDEGS